METTLPSRSGDLRRRSSLYQSVRRLDPSLDPNSATFEAALVVFCGQRVGPNVDRIANLTGLDRSHVARCVRRLVDAGVWGGAATPHRVGDGDIDAAAFRNDLAVAEGRLWRRIGPDGQVEWAPAGSWFKEYDFVPTHRNTGLTNVYHDRPPKPAEPAVVAWAKPRRRFGVRRSPGFCLRPITRCRLRAVPAAGTSWFASVGGIQWIG